MDYLNQFKKGSLIRAVADQKPPTEEAEPISSQKLEPSGPSPKKA
jgi:hypothetical protein